MRSARSISGIETPLAGRLSPKTKESFLPVLAVLGYLVIALYILVPIGTPRRRAARA